MKIICTLDEYSRMIRQCQRNLSLNECKGCVMENICGDNLLEDAVQFEIEDHKELDIEYVTYVTSERSE